MTEQNEEETEKPEEDTRKITIPYKEWLEWKVDKEIERRQKEREEREREQEELETPEPEEDFELL